MPRRAPTPNEQGPRRQPCYSHVCAPPPLVQAAAKAAPGGMATVTGASDAALQQALDKAAATVGGGKKAYIANYMFPEGRTCSGDLKAREIANPRPGQGHPIAMVMPTHPTSTSSITTKQ